MKPANGSNIAIQSQTPTTTATTTATIAGYVRSRTGSALDLGPALLLSGGVALYLIGEASFRFVLGIKPIAYRAAAAIVALATLPLGLGVSAAAQLVALVALLAGMLAIEEMQARGALSPDRAA